MKRVQDVLDAERRWHTLYGGDQGDDGACEGASTEVAVFTLAPDTAPRTVEVPSDLAARLTGELRERFDGLAYSHRKEYVVRFESAKREQTRAKQIDATIEKLAAQPEFRR